jgi:hypothetical protein
MVAATSALTATSLRSTSPALARSVSAVVAASWPSERSASVQRVGGVLGTQLELIGGGFGAPDQEVLEAADAAVEHVGDLGRAHAEPLVDLGGLGTDGVRDLAAARRDNAADRADTAVERVDDALAVVDQTGGEIVDARGEARLELRQAHVDRAGQLAGVTGQPLIEGIDVIAHCLGHVLRALAEPLDQFAAIGLHGAVELGHVAVDQAAERHSIARHLFGERGTALGEHLLEGLQPGGQHVLDRVGAAAERLRQRLGVVAERAGHRVAAVDQIVGDARAGLFQLGDHFVAAFAQAGRQDVAG